MFKKDIMHLSSCIYSAEGFFDIYRNIPVKPDEHDVHILF